MINSNFCIFFRSNLNAKDFPKIFFIFINFLFSLFLLIGFEIILFICFTPSTRSLTSSISIDEKLSGPKLFY